MGTRYHLRMPLQTYQKIRLTSTLPNSSTYGLSLVLQVMDMWLFDVSKPFGQCTFSICSRWFDFGLLCAMRSFSKKQHAS